jgi:hypothetical protein
MIIRILEILKTLQTDVDQTEIRPTAFKFLQ